MRNLKILVTGSNGTVASYIPSLFNDSKLFLTKKTDLDITNKSEVWDAIKTIKPNVIIHLAAETNVDYCEKNEKVAHNVNFLGTKYLSMAAKKFDATMVYMSTTAIFDGKKKFYTEKDSPNPLSVYGQTKYLGEKYILENLKKYFIIRSGWIVGGGIKEKKFVSYITNQLRQGQKEILAVDDRFGSLAYAKELVAHIKELLQNESFGLYHFGSTGVCSRFDIATFLNNELREKAKITPVRAKHFAETFSAPRPKYEVVKSIKKQFQRSWEESLRDYIKHELQATPKK